MNTGLIVAVDDEEMFASSLKILFQIEEFNAKVFTLRHLAGGGLVPAIGVGR